MHSRSDDLNDSPTIYCEVVFTLVSPEVLVLLQHPKIIEYKAGQIPQKPAALNSPTENGLRISP